MGNQIGKTNMKCRDSGCRLILKDKTCFALCDPAAAWRVNDCWALTKEKYAVAKRKNAMRAYASKKARQEELYAG